VIVLDGEPFEPAVPPSLRQLVRDLRSLGAGPASEALREAGLPCRSLHWGVPAPTGDGGEVVLWRQNHGAFGGAARVPLPLYPVVRAHVARGEPALHCGVVCGRSRAVLLLGRSGAGKSTAVRMARRAGARVACDDAAIVGWQAGVPVAIPLPGGATLGEPVPGEGFATGSRLPIAALCFLEQAPVDALTPLPRLEATRRLVAGSLLEIPAMGWLPREARVQTMDALRRLSAAVPAYRLELTPSARWLELLRREVSLDDA
jgi:hypothetical protein